MDEPGRRGRYSIGNSNPAISAEERPRQGPPGLPAQIAYTTPSGSGSAYSWEFVRAVFAMAFVPNEQIVGGTRASEPGEATLRASDAPLLTLAPILGDVLTIRKPLDRYRIHGTNASNSTRPSSQPPPPGCRDGPLVCNHITAGSPACRARSLEPQLQPPAISFRLPPGRALGQPFSGRYVIGLGCRLMCAAITYSQMRLRDLTILPVWIVACALTLPYYRRNLILWRFAAISRPAAIRTLLGVLAQIDAPSRPGLSAAR
jgi:hypothetical protein